MIERQVASVKPLAAVLASVFIPQKNVALGKGGFLKVCMSVMRTLEQSLPSSTYIVWLRNVLIQSNDTWQGDLQVSGANGDIRIDINHSDLSAED